MQQGSPAVVVVVALMVVVVARDVVVVVAVGLRSREFKGGTGSRQHTLTWVLIGIGMSIIGIWGAFAKVCVS